MGDEEPKRFGMIEFFEVAEFVDNDVIGEVGREKGEFVAKVEVTTLGATTPAGFLIPNGNFVVFKSVKLIKILQPIMNQPSSQFFMSKIFFLTTFAPYDASTSPHNTKFHLGIGVLLYEKKIHNPDREYGDESVEEPGRDVQGIFGDTVAFRFGFGVEEDNEDLFKGEGDTDGKTDNTDERANTGEIQDHRRNYSQKPSVETMNFKIQMKSVNHGRGEHEKRGRNSKSAKE